MKTFRMILAAIRAGMVTALLSTAAAESAAKSEEQPVTYATEIKPILDATCAKCHNAEKAKAGVRMDSLEGVLTGTKKRKLVEPGKSTESRLVRLVESIAAAANDPDGKTKAMHKKGVKPLTPEQIILLKSWIDQGAK